MPAIDEVNEAVRRFDREGEPGEWLLGQLFRNYRSNTDLNQVRLKTMVLNKIYNAGVIDEYAVAAHIKSLAGIDSLIDAGADNAVSQIANVEVGVKKKRKICFISFATKYCSWHNPTAYPIFDRNVRTCLLFYKKKDRFAKFTLDSLWDYTTFRKVVNEFRGFYGLESLNYKDLDKFMYLCGGKLLAEHNAVK